MVKKKTGRLLIWFGIVGVALPHILFLLGFFPTLDDPSHSLFELAVALLIWFGFSTLRKEV